MKSRFTNAWLAMILAGSAGCAVAAGAPATSAQLQLPEGPVFVGQGSTMVRARDGMPLSAGSRVTTAAGAKAEIVYPDGCVVHLKENSQLVIATVDQCRLGAARPQVGQNLRISAAPMTAAQMTALGVGAVAGLMAVGVSQVDRRAHDNPPISR
jgi:hypothetical protein